MIVLQTPWTTAEEDVLTGQLAAARATVVEGGPLLALLPHGNGGADEAEPENEVAAMLGRLARTHDLFLCASAYVKTNDDPAPRTVGFLVEPSGEVVLRTPKILPDLVEGFTDTVADTFKPTGFIAAVTPVGQIGIACGEDILAPHVVRSLVVTGAEIILNPSRERRDEMFEARQRARLARAYENNCYVATASPSSVTIRGVTAKLPAASLVAEWWGTHVGAGGDESFFTVALDLQDLRRRRQEPMRNFPVAVRMPLYAPGYAREAGQAQPTPATRKGWIAMGQRMLAAEARAPEPGVKREDRFDVVLCQCVSVRSTSPDQLVENRRLNLEAAIGIVQSTAKSPAVRLVVFPEFFLTGATSPLGSRSSQIADLIGITFPGPEADRLAQFAQETKSYVAGGVFEYDPAWPGRFFNSAFIFDDSGNLIHRYRKIHCADVFGMLPDTTPGSVYDQYVDRYGYESLFPVADTPLGRIATKVCFDINFPETARAMVQRGAEIIVHPTSEPHNLGRRGWDHGRHTRAYENLTYILTAGHGGEYRGSPGANPSFMNRGYSKVVNFDGSLQAVADGPGALPLSGSLDMKSLRTARADIKNNLALWDDPVVYKHVYAAGRGLPNNLWATDPTVNPYEKMKELRKVVADYTAQGIYVAPEGGAGSDLPSTAAR